MVAWLQTNWATVVAPLVVALLDLAFALSPSIKANGIAHQIYLWAGGKPPASS